MTARTPSAAAALRTARRSGSFLSLATGVLLLGGMVLASPAAAVDDPSKPDARVTHGPSCHPGGVVVEVTGGTVAYDVTFATTRTHGGEDAAQVPAGETVVLRTGDVSWGETIDGRLEYTALDGSGTSFVDPLDGYTFTRPAEEDCAAITAPAAAATVPRMEPVPDGEVAPAGPASDGAIAEDDAPVAGTGSVPTDGRSDGTRPGGTDAAGGAGTPGPGPGKAEAPGAAAGVDLIETAAAPAPVPASGSPTAFLVAVASLGATLAGLAGVLGLSRRAGRRPTASG